MYFFFFFFFYLFYLWLCWVFVSVRGLSLVVASGDNSSSRCAGLSASRPLLLRSTGSRRAGSVIVAHGPSRSAACGIFPDQGSNPHPPHWQADSQPLRHQGSPLDVFLERSFFLFIITTALNYWFIIRISVRSTFKVGLVRDIYARIPWNRVLYKLMGMYMGMFILEIVCEGVLLMWSW